RHREAIESIPDDHPERSEYFDTFAIDCKAAFDLTSNAAFLEEAISSLEAAVAIGEQTKTVPRQYVADYANNLGAALIARFERTGEVADLSAAVAHMERAVDLVPAQYPRLPTLLSNAGAVRLRLFEKTGEVNQLEQATSLKRQA